MAYAMSHYGLFDLLKNYMPGDFNPPLYMILLWLWTRIFGISEIALRFPSVIYGTITVWLIYLFALKLKSLKLEIGPVHAAIFAATAPLLIFYSQEARMYMLSCMLVTMSMYFFYRQFYLKENVYLVYLVSTIAMFWSHYVAWFIWLSQLIIIFLVKKDYSKNTIIRIFLPLAGIIPLLPFLFSQLQTGIGSAQSLPVWSSLSAFSLKALLLIPIKIVSGRIPFSDKLFTSILILTATIIWILMITKTLDIYRRNNEKTDLKNTGMLWLWLTMPVITGIIISVKISLFSYFRFLYIAPAFYLLAAQGIKKYFKSKQAYIVVVLLIFNSYFSYQYLFKQENHREDWKSAVTYITSRNLSEKVVILNSVSAPFWYYDKGKHELLDYAQIGELTDSESFWLIKYAQPIFDPSNRAEEQLITQMGYEILEEKHFRGDIGLKYLVKSTKSFAYDNRN